MPFIEVLGVAPDATEIDIQHAAPSYYAKNGPVTGRFWQFLKTVPRAGLAVGAKGGLLVPISGSEDAPGRLFRSVNVRVEPDGTRSVSPPSPSDYHNRAPYSAGTVRLPIPQSVKEPFRFDLASYLFDEDTPGGKLVLTSRKEETAEVEVIPPSLVAQQLPTRYPVFLWAFIEGTVLVVDASVVRSESRLTVSLTDEKGETSTLDVIVTVLAATAPPAPTGVVYIP